MVSYVAPEGPGQGRGYFVHQGKGVGHDRKAAEAMSDGEYTLIIDGVDVDNHTAVDQTSAPETLADGSTLFTEVRLGRISIGEAPEGGSDGDALRLGAPSRCRDDHFVVTGRDRYRTERAVSDRLGRGDDLCAHHDEDVSGCDGARLRIDDAAADGLRERGWCREREQNNDDGRCEEERAAVKAADRADHRTSFGVRRAEHCAELTAEWRRTGPVTRFPDLRIESTAGSTKTARATAPTLIPRYVDEVRIRNFRGITDLRLKAPQMDESYLEWLMLIGENAAGKSSVLQAMALNLMSAAERFLPDVLALPVPERAKLVHRLLESLESVPEGDLDAVWAAELERRAIDVASGVVAPVSWSAARANILDELEERRAARNTP